MHRDLDDGYVLDDDRERIDRDTVYAYLSEQTYWALGRERAVMDDLFDSAYRLGGLYDREGVQVGFARVVSDGHTVSYLADVYVLPELRGRGLGLELVRFVVDAGGIADTKWLLHTRDMHPLYAKLGFVEPSERVMERFPTRG